MLKLEISVEEANIILASLSKQPYEAVSALIGKIHSQANEQLNPKDGEKPKKSK
jgi:hypothetical protein